MMAQPLTLLLSLILAAFLAAGAARAEMPPRTMVVFGDSLSDAGNAGRFSDGPVWVEHLAGHFGMALRPARQGGGNFAVGGARMAVGQFSLREQLDRFLEGPHRRHATETTLFVVWGGANDLLASVRVADRAALVEHTVAALRTMLLDLADAGARDLLVPNLPNIGRTPQVRALGEPWVREAEALTRTYNRRLAEMLHEVEAAVPVRLIRLDVFALLEQGAEAPGRFGFHNATEPCLQGGAPRVAACEGYVFWDSLHPTGAAHARLAEAALRVLPAG